MEEEYDDPEEKYRIYETDEDFVSETRFEAERDAYLRTHIGSGEEGGEQIQLLYGKNMAEVYRELYRKGYTDEDRFKVVIAVAKSQLSGYNFSISSGDIEIIKNRVIKNAPTKINYLNSICLILGYYVTDGGKSAINREKLERVVKLLPKIKDVTASDVIRYCRFWSKL